MKRNGFTLIEIMIVVAVIAILATIAVPVFLSYRAVSRKNACKANIGMLDRATEAYIIHKNLANDAEVTVEMLVPKSLDGLKTDYFIRNTLECPAGGQYQYSSSSQSWHCTACGAQ